MTGLTKDQVTVVYPNLQVTGVGNSTTSIFQAMFGGVAVVVVNVTGLYLSNDLTGVLTPLTMGADYVVNANQFVLTVPPDWNFTLVWSGEGYYITYPDVAPLVSLDLLSVMTWRFDQSTNIVALLTNKDSWYQINHVNFWNSWYSSVFNLKTASNFGMAVWAFILDLPMSVLSLQDTFRYWAFGTLRSNFTDTGQVPMNPTSGNFPPAGTSGGITSPKEKIAALRLKYYSHISDRSVWNINDLLNDVFFEQFGNAYVLDNEDMTATYVFEFEISTLFQSAMLEYDLLPRPGGVKISIQTPP